MSSSALDASGLLALLNQEPGDQEVAAALRAGTAISTVNLSEVVAKLADAGMPEAAIRAALATLPLEAIAFDEELAYACGVLRPLTRRAGLSFGDRACLALAQQLAVPALTADRAWSQLQLGIGVRVVR